MKKLTSHKVNGVNDMLDVCVLEEGQVYHVRATKGNASGLRIDFQKGPLGEYPNGLTNEVLLTILQDRLTHFQSGKFACEENAQALDHISKALDLLHQRTIKRIERGVEGQLVP